MIRSLAYQKSTARGLYHHLHDRECRGERAVSVDAEVDVIVVGGGVVGLACALELAATRQVAVIERHERVGLETSSHNSGVIHAGIYYPTGSLKHTLCLEGNGLIYEWCATHAVRAHRTGKLIIAVDDTELSPLDALARQADENGVPEITMIRGPR